MRARALPYLLILPAALFLLVFFVYPAVQIGLLAVTGPEGFTLRHLQTMAGHWKFGPALRWTLLLAAVVVPIQLVLALGMASIVTRLKAGRDTVLYLFSIPLGLSDLAAGIIWLAIFEQSGFLNSLLYHLGAIERPVLFLGYKSVGTIFLAVVLAEVWRATAIVMVILVAGMGLIPREYDEAGQVFGANAWQRFTRITLPLLRPSLQSALILRTLNALEVFAVVVALGGTTLPVLMGETYQWQFTLRDRNVAAAYALVILGISVAATLFYLRALRVPKGATP